MNGETRLRMLVLLLQAIRAQCAAVDLAIAHFLEFLKEDNHPDEDLPQDPQEAPEEKGCPHPPDMRIPSPAMGHLHRYYCSKCGETVE